MRVARRVRRLSRIPQHQSRSARRWNYPMYAQCMSCSTHVYAVRVQSCDKVDSCHYSMAKIAA